ncbi:AAA domain-containing protein [Microlunatus sp. GCM10028923]|uniref:AAA domain-containing protein n=1 Tax=Microlunatus sp. GCM10028923 TaxID=3273400 RepID=UPI00360CED6F
MIDVDSQLILIRSKKTGQPTDKTAEIESCHEHGSKVLIKYINGSETYGYPRERAWVLRDPERVRLGGTGPRIEVKGDVWENAIEALRFSRGTEVWWKIRYKTSDGERQTVRCGGSVRLLPNCLATPDTAAVLGYWRSIGARLDDASRSIRTFYQRLEHLSPDSLLGRYLQSQPLPAPVMPNRPLIFPFRSNLSQREAVRNALGSPVSVIFGPPGTGKTQTILNLVANLVVQGETTVAIVSSNNAAVENVASKLAMAGFGYIAAPLGRSEKVDRFFAGQPARNAQVDALRHGDEPESVLAADLDALNSKIHDLQEAERRAGRIRQELAAYRLEQQHFERAFDRRELPELGKVPLLTRSAETILAYLAEVDVDLGYRGPVARFIGRIRRYFRYGPTGGLDVSDVGAVLRLQRIYYEKRVGELREDLARTEQQLSAGTYDRLIQDQQRTSELVLRRALWQRYQGGTTRYDKGSYRRNFAEFSADFPVILSTCDSLGNNLGGNTVDYLIIDEASQVNLLQSGAAMACAKNLVVVGDLNQLPHIPGVPELEQAPASDYDYFRHSILSSLVAMYGDSLPKVELIEHYRCAPDIIEFCNQKFYDGRLIPYTGRRRTESPLVIWTTPPGFHMRTYRSGGRFNQREIEVIREEVIPQVCGDLPVGEVGITTPYRRQADKLGETFGDFIESDTVHKYQGREKLAMVLTTVLDESKSGHFGITFVDDPRLINVAVSRAIERFVLVIDNKLLPRSRHIRDLVGYIEYHDPHGSGARESKVISVFDLLYRDYSRQLRPLAARLSQRSRYRSENIMWSVLEGIVAEDPYRVFAFRAQVKLRALVPDTELLDEDELKYVRHAATSVDFVVFNRMTKKLACAIEVDGFEYHENKPEQLARDAKKDAICAKYGVPLLRLPTTGSREPDRIRNLLDRVLAGDSAAG